MFCEACGKEHDGTYGSGRFCSSACAHKRHLDDITKKRISSTLKNKKLNKNYFNYVRVKDNPNLNLPVRKCIVCGQLFYHTRDRKTCCKECNKINHDNLNKAQKGQEKLKYKDNKNWNDNAYQQIYKYYFTYKIVNLVNNKYYYGIHATNNLDDGYMGSGKFIKQAIKKIW